MPDAALLQSPAAETAAHPATDPGYVVEVGGKCVSQYETLTAALSAGLTLKGQDAGAQVKVYQAKV